MNQLKLKAKILESGYTLDTLSEKLGLSKSALCSKNSLKRPYKLDEIKDLIKLLKLSKDDTWEIFFK